MIGHLSRFITRFVISVASRSTDLCHIADIANIRDRALVNTTNADQHGENVG